jgi:hypothetical protein
MYTNFFKNFKLRIKNAIDLILSLSVFIDHCNWNIHPVNKMIDGEGISLGLI